MTPGLPLEFDPTDYGGRDSEEDLIAATMGTAGSAPPPSGADGDARRGGYGNGDGDGNSLEQGQRKHSDHRDHGVTWERGSGPALAVWLEANGLDSSLAPPLAQLCAQHTPLVPPSSSSGQGHRSRSRSGSGTGTGGAGAGDDAFNSRGMSAAERVADLPLGPSLTCLLRHCSLREIVLVAEALNRATVLRDEAPNTHKPSPLEPLTTHLGAPPNQESLPKAAPAVVTPPSSSSHSASSQQAALTKEEKPGVGGSACPGSCEDDEASPPWATWASSGWNMLTGAASVAASVAREEVADFGAPGRRRDSSRTREEDKLPRRQVVEASPKPHASASGVSKANTPSSGTVVSQPRASDSPNPTTTSSADGGNSSKGSGSADCSDVVDVASSNAPSQQGSEEGDNWQHKVNSLVD